MATVNDANALFKRIWGDGPIKAIPQQNKIMKATSFSSRDRLGDMFVVPLVLTSESGFSYSAHGGGAFSLNDSVAGSMQQAQIRGSMIALRSQISWEDMAKAAASGDQAFESALTYVVENMQRSFAKRQEVTFLYGQRGVGKVSTNSSGTLTIDSAEWAPGIFTGSKGTILEAFDSQSASATQDNADLTISSVSLSAKQVVVTGTSSSVDSSSYLYFKGARTTTAHREMAGLDALLANTGTLFNIDAATYELWQAQSYNVGGAISMLAIMQGVALCQNAGLEEDAVLYVATKRWNSLNSDQAALRRYGAYASTAETGSEAITYHSVNGGVKVEAHPFVKEGFAYLVPNPKKHLMRLGSTDITFRSPMGEDQVIRTLNDNLGWELRAFSDQSLCLKIPAQACRYTGIVD